MSSYKQTRKEISEPDPFLKKSSGYLEKAAANKKTILAVGGALLVLAVVIIAISGISRSKSRAAGEALSEAMTLVARPVSEGGQSSPGESAAFPTKQAKYEALEAAFQKICDEHAGTQAARSAAYYLADAKLNLGKYEEADKLYAAFIAQTEAGAPMRLMALEGRAYAAEARGNTDAALGIFQQMGKESQDESWKTKADFHAARMREIQGKKQEAADGYAAIVRDHKKIYTVSAHAQERLAILASQGIRPAPAEKADGAQKK